MKTAILAWLVCCVTTVVSTPNIVFSHDFQLDADGPWQIHVLALQAISKGACPELLPALQATDKIITLKLFTFACTEAQAWLERMISRGDLDVEDFTPSDDTLKRLNALQNLWAMAELQSSPAAETESAMRDYVMAGAVVRYWAMKCESKSSWCCFYAMLRLELNSAVEHVCRAHGICYGSLEGLVEIRIKVAMQVLDLCPNRSFSM